MSFDGKHVVVTGGTGALGTAVVGQLLAQGAIVHIPNYAASELDHFAHANHQRVTVTSDIDLTDEGQVERFYQALPSLWASIHIAGGFDMSAIAETSKAAFMTQMTMNATTCFLSCREAIKAMRTSEGVGRIVNVAARPGIEPRTGAGMSAYTASKAAVAAFTQAVAEEVASEGIWVNAVAPSIMDTPGNRAGMPDADHSAWPTTDEVAASILYLASPTNGSARGGVIPVFGKS